jgi:hypothetical protein
MTLRRWRSWGPYALAVAAQLAFAGYVKDDAFIEYRYATNLARGHGLVFNVGDPPVEGSTTFLWTVGLALPARLGLDLLWVAKLLGALAVLGGVVLVGRLVRARGGDERQVSWARWLMATNAAVLVWGQSGMEPLVAALAVLAGVLWLERGQLVLGAAALAVGAAVRPEVHLVVALAVPLLVARARDRAARPAALAALAVAGALLGTMHLLRWRIYGSLVPNTALVKTASIDLRAGLVSVAELGVTSLGGVVIALALDEARRRRDAISLLCGSALVGFLLYLIRVGKDEMGLARLYLPVLPLALALGALRLGHLPPKVARVTVAVVALAGLGFTLGHLRKSEYTQLAARSYVPLARAMCKNAQPGDLAVFQDLGRTPYEALELRFIDPIGLVDRHIASELHAAHATPYLRAAPPAVQARLRDYLFERHPQLFAFVAYIDPGSRAEVRRRFDAGERAELLAPYLAANSYHFGLAEDPRLRERYHFVDAWRRTDGYYLALYAANLDP